MDEAQFKQEMFAASGEVQKMLHRMMGPVCQTYGVTVQQLHVLAELRREPGQTVGQLGTRAGILKTNFSPVCRRLEARGLVERTQCTHDRRAYVLHLTEDGRRLLEHVDADVSRRYGKAFAAEPPETLDTIVAGFRALNAFTAKLGD